MTITSIGYDGSINETQWANLASALGAQYAVLDATHWKVEPVAGSDRTVRILSGSGYGHGVLDESDALVTIQLPTIASGSRWDLIVARRDWQPPGGATTFTYVSGNASRVIPSTRASSPGITDEQPLALVQVTAGQTLPTAIVDLRCWHGNGGMMAASTDALSYLTMIGSVVIVDNIAWVRSFDASGIPAWTPMGTEPSWTDITGKPATFTPSAHTHDDRYFTETEVNAKLDTKSDTAHHHDGRYAAVNHAHSYAATNHGHDYRYYSQTVLRSDGTDRAHGNTPAGSGWFSVWVDGNRNFCHNTSSIRYKENVRDYPLDPDKVLALRPRLYDRKGEDTPSNEFGLIAEEVNEYVPELVQWMDKEDGNGPMIEALRYDLLGVALLPVVQRQQRQIDDLTARLARLEGSAE